VEPERDTEGDTVEVRDSDELRLRDTLAESVETGVRFGVHDGEIEGVVVGSDDAMTEGVDADDNVMDAMDVEGVEIAEAELEALDGIVEVAVAAADEVLLGVGDCELLSVADCVLVGVTDRVGATVCVDVAVLVELCVVVDELVREAVIEGVGAM